MGPTPTGNGEPGTGDSLPVRMSIENALIVLSPPFSTYRKSFAKVVVIPPPPLPRVGNGDPGIGVRAPLAPTKKAETVLTLSPLFV